LVLLHRLRDLVSMRRRSTPCHCAYTAPSRSCRALD
jgi:hypothetical protein